MNAGILGFFHHNGLDVAHFAIKGFFASIFHFFPFCAHVPDICNSSLVVQMMKNKVEPFGGSQTVTFEPFDAEIFHSTPAK